LGAVDYYACHVLGMRKSSNSDVTYVAVSGGGLRFGSKSPAVLYGVLSNLSINLKDKSEGGSCDG
jgi:hypothetical protein